MNGNTIGWLGLWGVLLVVMTGCAVAQTARSSSSSRSSNSAGSPSLAEIYAISNSYLSCQQAQQLVHRTVERMGYTVTALTLARQEHAGVIKAERHSRGRVEPVRVTVGCNDSGVAVDAASLSSLDVASDNPHPLVTVYSVRSAQSLTDNRPPPTTYFRRAFYSLFNGLALHAKQYGPEGQLHVNVRPFQKLEAELEFGPQAADVFVVTVEVSNLTPQTYVFDTGHVLLLTEEGVQVKALEGKDVVLPTRPLVSQALASRVTTKGYLYYPAGEYVGAQGYLTEVDSQERAGFQIEF